MLPDKLSASNPSNENILFLSQRKSPPINLGLPFNEVMELNLPYKPLPI